MKLHVIHNERKKFQCVFNTLIIKNEALEKLYEDGFIGFLDKYGGECNGKITVVCYMAADIDETIDDLLENGLKFFEDFVFIDASDCLISVPESQASPNNKKQRIGWLKGGFVKGHIYVWYNGNYKDDS